MSLTNPNKVVTEERLSEFYGQILPYMGGMPDVLANKFSRSDIYSTEEKMIGCWVDNRPLYQKTVTTGGNVPSGATLIQRTTQTGYDTILYTKTTDSPISIGSDTDYSTTEKIVGTWIDGRPIYQKTFDINVPMNSGSATIFDPLTAITNLESIIKDDFVGKRPADAGYVPLPLMDGTGTPNVSITLLGNSNPTGGAGFRKYRFTTTFASSDITVKATLQYTKTS